MNIFFSLILGIVTVLSGYGFYTDTTPKEMANALGSTMTGSAWFVNTSGDVQTSVATWGLRIPSLGSSGDCLVTDINGVVSTSGCGTGGGGNSNWLFDGNRLTPSTTVGIGVFASSTITQLSMANATVTSSLNLFGTIGTALSDFCVAITGGSGLCDGIDNTAAGGSGLSTSTNIADTEIIFATSPSTVGSEPAFTYNDATDLLTTVNLVATNATATTLSTGALAVTGNGTTTFGGGLDIGDNHIIAHGIQSHGSGGLHIHSNNGTEVAFFGVGGGSNSTFVGGLNIDGATRLATSLNGFGYLTNGAVTATTSGTSLKLDYTASSTYSTIDDFFHLQSSGKISGGQVTDIGGGSVSVDSGTALIKIGALSTSNVVFSDFAASTSIPIPTNTNRWIGVEYNAGVPRIVVLTSDSFSYNDSFPLAIVTNEAGVIHINENARNATDVGGQLIRRFHQTLPYARDELAGGLILGETGTRNVTLSTGYLWDRNNRFTIPAIDTSVSGSFDAYYRDGAGGFTTVMGQTQWDNDSYDDGSGTLASLTPARYANLWWYIEADGNLVMVYGRNQYTTLAAATAGTIPTTLPLRLQEGARLVARTTFQNGGATWADNASSWTTTLPSSVTTHSNLSGLAWTTSGHTGTANTLAGFSSTGVAAEYTTSTPSVTAPITYSGTFGSLIGGVSGSFGCTSASSIVTGCLTSADWAVFNNKVSSTSIDTSAEIAALVTDETGTAGSLVFSVSPTFTGLTTMGNFFATNGTTTNATSTNSFFSALGTFTNLVVNTLATFLNVVVTGLLDVGGGVLEIPNGTAPTIDSIGETGLDSTDDQLIIADGAGTARVYGVDEFRVISVTIASSSPRFATTQSLAALGHKDGLEITQYRCYVVGGTSKVVNITDGTNDTETITCGTTMTSDTDVTTNDTFTANELGYIEMGATTGVVDYLHFEAYARITRE